MSSSDAERRVKKVAVFVPNYPQKFKYFIRDNKVGEGTYAIVYHGWAVPCGERFDLEEWKSFVQGKIDSDEWSTFKFDDCAMLEKATKFPFRRYKRIAIKKIKVSSYRSGINISAVREIKFLQELSHPNVIRLLDVFIRRANLYLVLEYLGSDLEMMIKNSRVGFSTAHIKSWLMMALRGIRYCHEEFILHRDLKPSNLLLARDGQLKIADFGISRSMGDVDGPMTSIVVTRWYRSPELLLGSTRYGYGIDIWALGCIFAEMMLRIPFLPGDSDIGQLNLIFRCMGTPTEQCWPNMKYLPGYHEPIPIPAQPLKSIFTAGTPDSLDLLSNMLKYNPLKRPTAEACLTHAYFKNYPEPTPPSKLPKLSPDEVTTSRRDRILHNPGSSAFPTNHPKKLRKC